MLGGVSDEIVTAGAAELVGGVVVVVAVVVVVGIVGEAGTVVVVVMVVLAEVVVIVGTGALASIEDLLPCVAVDGNPGG